MQGLYAWWQYDLCDNFIELVKPAMQLENVETSSAARKQAFRDTLWLCLDIGLRWSPGRIPQSLQPCIWQRARTAIIVITVSFLVVCSGTKKLTTQRTLVFGPKSDQACT